jgi:hypothetical protein
LQTLNPLADSRWQALVERHAQASAFHSEAWLRALHKTYGYEPVVLTDAAQGMPLENGLVFCKVESWLTGRRLVSLPFSDHCEPLTREGETTADFLGRCAGYLRPEKWDYVEFRPRESVAPLFLGSHTRTSYCYHELNLEPDLATLASAFHKDSIQRKLRRAQREGLTYREGRSQELLEHFYRLFLMTRRRHLIPPQPAAWFENLAETFGEALKIRIAYQGSKPTASILTIQHKSTMVYKYGCSDPELTQLGGTPMLFWETIQESKRRGLRVLDLGRSDVTGEGLIRFKERWGASRSELAYLRLTDKPESWLASGSEPGGWGKWVMEGTVPHLPDAILRGLGKFLYRHIG